MLKALDEVDHARLERTMPGAGRLATLERRQAIRRQEDRAIEQLRQLFWRGSVERQMLADERLALYVGLRLLAVPDLHSMVRRGLRKSTAHEHVVEVARERLIVMDEAVDLMHSALMQWACTAPEAAGCRPRRSEIRRANYAFDDIDLDSYVREGLRGRPEDWLNLRATAVVLTGRMNTSDARFVARVLPLHPAFRELDLEPDASLHLAPLDQAIASIAKRPRSFCAPDDMADFGRGLT